MSLPQLGRTIARTSLADSVYEALLEAIVGGKLLPGAELSAVALSSQLEVSRTPITEAIRRLEHDGLVEQVSNHQARVTRLLRADVDEVYQMRMCLEGLSAELAAQRMTKETCQSLQANSAALAAARGSVDWCPQAIHFDLEFHDQLAQAANNGRLLADIRRYRRLVRSFCRLTGMEANLWQAFEEHQEILAALEARKPAAARKAMVAHIAARRAVVLQELFPE